MTIDDNLINKMDGRYGLSGNNFVNDGSFMEIFKKMMENQQQNTASSPSVSSTATTTVKTALAGNTNTIGKQTSAIVGKRRGGRILPTGIVKKTKTTDDTIKTEKKNIVNSKTENELSKKKDAWSVYLEEVKRYKETTCSEEDGKTRPLIK